jgi:hypothetical protein
VVRRLDEGIEENDVTGLYMVDAATGHPRYIRTAHIVDISPEVE